MVYDKSFKKSNKLVFDKQDTYSLRGLCIILIIFHHLYQNTYYHYGVPYPHLAIIVLDSIGYLSTAVFFLLSGYGLSFSINKNGISYRYVLTHLLKLLLPFVFIWLIDTICQIFTDGDQFNQVFNLLTLSISRNNYWFLKIIFVLYVTVFLVHKYIKKTTGGILFLTLCYIIIMSLVLKENTYWWNSVICFPLGMLCQQCAIMRQCPRKIVLWCSLFLVGFVLSVIAQEYISDSSAALPIKVVSMCTCAVSFSFIAIYSVSRINIRNPLTNYAGKHSLPIYLFHIFFVNFYPSNIFVYVFMVLSATVVFVYIYDYIQRGILKFVS